MYVLFVADMTPGPDYYEAKAREMEEAASRLPPGSHRDEYAKLAQRWRELAVAAKLTQKRGV